MVAPTEDEEEGLILETEDAEAPEDQPESDVDDEELVLTFADEAPEEAESAEESPLAKHLREELRARTRELRELRRQAGQAPGRPDVIEVGEKPTLDSCGFDPDLLEEELGAWMARKAQAEKAEAEHAEQAKRNQQEWAGKIADYERKKADLRVPGKAEAEAEALANLSQHQQAVIVKYADNPAALMIALGKSPKKLEALSGMNDLAQFTFTVAKLEKELKMAKRKAPEPEGIVRGAAPLSNTSDKQLEKLEREAARTGDRSAVIRYKAQLKKSKAA